MMYSYIITMMNNKKSVKAAKRCAKTAREFGYYPSFFKAITPEDNPIEIFERENLPVKAFHTDTRYSRLEPAMCCFLSHRELWKISIEKNQTILVLEHDAVFKNKVPAEVSFHDFVNLGKPSYGKYRLPQNEGVYDLFSKPGGYLPGTHAYILTPRAAGELLNYSKVKPAPADLFLNKNTFPWIKEYYPWPIEADDSFTTVQKVEGSIAKHNYGEDYEIL